MYPLTAGFIHILKILIGKTALNTGIAVTPSIITLTCQRLFEHSRTRGRIHPLNIIMVLNIENNLINRLLIQIVIWLSRQKEIGDLRVVFTFNKNMISTLGNP